MNQTRWLAIRSLFETVCDLPAGKRETLLAGAEASLRADVESLLATERSPQLLEAGAARVFPEVFEPDRLSSMAGRRVGPYQLTRLIASGGMGAVFLAARADEAYEQQVAIKLTNLRMATPASVQRFRAERQTLARLDHPNIARLLDGGVTGDGLPFLVMEYVPGTPIDRYCAEQRLPTRERLRLFCQVCHAVSYAHRNLVVHRDLKPANILVTKEGVPKLVDFGIAKVLDGEADRDGAEATATAQRLMTPEYASPEQVRGEPISTASDVYSLGVILYELLAGCRPYRLSNCLPHEIERTVCEEEPQRPSTALSRGGGIAEAAAGTAPEGGPGRRRRKLAGDLDAIVLMALRKEPSRRYSSVEHFSEDIRRHLEGLPVLARKDSLRYRTARFLKRHRAAAVASAIVTLSLVGGLAAALWQARAALDAQRQSAIEAAKVRQVNTFLTTMLVSADTTAAPGPEGALRLMLDEATASLQAGALNGQRDVEASVRMTVGMAYLQMGRLAEAREQMQTALELRRGLHGAEHPAVAECLDGLGLAAKATGDHAAALRLYREALDLRARFLGTASPEYAETLNNLGVALKTAERLEEAEPLLAESLGVRRAILDHRLRDAAVTEPQRNAGRRDVATTMTNLAAVLKGRGAFDEAESLYREALATFREALGNGHYRVAVALNNLALLLVEERKLEEAEALYREALAIRRKVFGDEHLAVATGLKNLAQLLMELGRLEEAEPLYREALELGRRLPGDAQRLANTLEQLADLLVTLGRYGEAEPLCNEALAIRRGRDAGTARLAGCLAVLARVHMGRGEAAAALPLLREAVALYEKRSGPPGRQLAEARSDLGGCLLALGQLDEAEGLLLESLAWIEADHVHGPGLAPGTLRRLVDLYDSWGRPERAALYRQALEESQDRL